jgi:putative sensory transduction regulator
MSPADALGQILAEGGFSYENPRPGAYLVKLDGTHRLATMCWLVAGDHSLLVEAFFLRKPDDDPAALHAWLLDRNASMYGVAFAVDGLGDVYLVGRLPLSAISGDEIDRLLGCVLTYSDGSFDRALELGFADAIRREWAWRTSRGESTANLAAFAHLVPDGPVTDSPS